MDFLGGALPNIMFIIGILAIGLGLGIELKLVALNKEIDKTGRIGAIVVGALLGAASLFIYLNPALTNRNQASSATVTAALAPAAANSAPVQLAATAAPAVAAIAAPPEAPTALAAPTATIVPTDAPTAIPASSAVPPTTTAMPMIKVPDLRGLDDKGAQRKLEDAGLTPKKTEKCSAADQGELKAKKGRVQCQNPAANQSVAPGSMVEYVLAGT
jgi:hypothetical protein